MRTLLILAGGLVLWAVFLGFGRLFGAPARATWAFVALWFAIAAVNLWVGVTQAGYTVMEELPIFLLIFGLPSAVALLVGRKLH